MVNSELSDVVVMVTRLSSSGETDGPYQVNSPRSTPDRYRQVMNTFLPSFLRISPGGERINSGEADNNSICKQF